MWYLDPNHVLVANALKPIVGWVGAIGTPGYTFVGDEDTGAYHPAANQFGVTAGGMQQAVFAGTPITLTDETATAVATIYCPTSGMFGATFTYTITATESSHWQSRAGTISVAVVNEGGTSTVTFSAPSEADSSPTGTLTASWSAVDNGGNVTVKVTADSSLTSPTVQIRLNAVANSETSGEGVTIP
jgi:hypothetical protein